MTLLERRRSVEGFAKRMMPSKSSTRLREMLSAHACAGLTQEVLFERSACPAARACYPSRRGLLRPGQAKVQRAIGIRLRYARTCEIAASTTGVSLGSFKASQRSSPPSSSPRKAPIGVSTYRGQFFTL